MARVSRCVHMDGDLAYLVRNVLCFYTLRGGKILWADLFAVETPVFLLHYSWSLLSKLSPNEQVGEILDVKLWDRMETSHIGSCAVVAKAVVISRAAGLPTVSFLVCVPLEFILLCLVVVSHCSTFL